MSKTFSLHVADIHALHELVGECRELGDDPGLWRQHLAARLGDWTGAGVVCVFELRSDPYGWSGHAYWGWEARGLDSAARNRFSDAFQVLGPRINPIPVRYQASFNQQDGGALTFGDLIRKAEYQQSPNFEHHHRPIGGDAQLTCLGTIPGMPGGHCGLVLAGPAGHGDFNRRHRSLVREAITLIAPLVGGQLSRHGEPSPCELPPRVRQVLRCLLEGEGDKQIAARMNICPQTVNAHTKAIYRHFGVQSRSELLARWLRRRWGSRCTWAE